MTAPETPSRMRLKYCAAGCANPSGKLLVVYYDDKPNVRYYNCQDCRELQFVEVFSDGEAIPPHPENCLCCKASEN